MYQVVSVNGEDVLKMGLLFLAGGAMVMWRGVVWSGVCEGVV